MHTTTNQLRLFPAPPIACRVSVRRRHGITLLGITSPKTGTRLEVPRHCLAGLPRIAGRIVKSIGRGMQASFTVAELRAFYTACRRAPVKYVSRPAWR